MAGDVPSRFSSAKSATDASHFVSAPFGASTELVPSVACFNVVWHATNVSMDLRLASITPLAGRSGYGCMVVWGPWGAWVMVILVPWGAWFLARTGTWLGPCKNRPGNNPLDT